jgi:Sigma-70, region 4
MSQTLRQAFTMVFYDELTIQEGAAQLGIAAGTFKTRVYRVKKYLINEKHLDLFGPLRKRTDSSFSSCTDNFALAKGPSATSAPEAAFS